MEPRGGWRSISRKEVDCGKGRFVFVEDTSSKGQCLLCLSNNTEVIGWETVLPETCSHTTSMRDFYNGAYHKLYKSQDHVLFREPRRARENTGPEVCPAGRVGGESAEFEEPLWAEDDIVLVERVNNSEGEHICAWGTSMRSLSCMQGCAATSSPRRRESGGFIFPQTSLCCLPSFSLQHSTHDSSLRSRKPARLPLLCLRPLCPPFLHLQDHPQSVLFFVFI